MNQYNNILKILLKLNYYWDVNLPTYSIEFKTVDKNGTKTKVSFHIRL